MLLKELFDKPLKYRWIEKDSDYYVASFSFINSKYNTKITYDVEFDNRAANRHNDYEITFAMTDRDRNILVPKIGITNSGDEIKVFSTIMKIIENFVNMKNPKFLIFRAAENSRIKLYSKIINRYANNFGYKLKFNQEDDQDKTVFNLERIDIV